MNERIKKQMLEIAEKEYDGHYTLMKFTTNYRFCFGTLMDVNPLTTTRMAKGKTEEEAIENGIKENVNCYSIEDSI